MSLLSLKYAWQPLLFESEDSGEVWKLFCGLQNKMPKTLLFNEANHEILREKKYWRYLHGGTVAVQVFGVEGLVQATLYLKNK